MWWKIFDFLGLLGARALIFDLGFFCLSSFLLGQ